MIRHTLLGLTLLACGVAQARPPRLTLFITVDSLSAELWMRSRANMPQMTSTLVPEGAYFPAAHYEYAETVTGPGHATLSTGSNPWRHGVVSNQIFDRVSGKAVHIFADPERPILEAPAAPGDSSPKNLMAEALADRLRISTQERGKALAVTGKARSAIALAGKLGKAWWFHEGQGKFVTSTWYAKEFPDWVKAFNARKLPDAYFGKQWTLALPKGAYVGEDDRPFESDGYGMGRSFPHPLHGGLSTPGPDSYAALAASPFGNTLVLEAARAAIVGEKLGTDDVPDILFVGLSSVDRVYHLYGPYSWETQDVMARLDQELLPLLQTAERAAGRGNVLVVLTGDHGGAAVPEEWAALGVPAQRISTQALLEPLARDLKTRFGIDPLLGIEEVDVYLSEAAMTERKLDPAQVRRAVANWLREHPLIASAWTREELSGTAALRDEGEAFRRGYFPGRSGDVQFLLRPYAVLTDEKGGTSHGTPYHYDRDVPLVIRGPGVRKGVYLSSPSTTSIASTVGVLLGVGIPAQAEGEPLGILGAP